ncbi:hypothetical protein C1876_10980 [Eggerthella sinensis]|uniref:Chloride channel protein n=2 Tax=Eggerthella sinensis TaxID=242230 RepID=A0ABX9HK75_9ACTN|nr:hypothetical protein C1876_10980 [Eggerthella sinensis]
MAACAGEGGVGSVAAGSKTSSVLRWACAAAAIGAVAGACTVALGWAVDGAVAAFSAHGQLVWLLPVAGLATYGLYRALRLDFSLGTSDVIEAARSSRPVPRALAPAIFLGTCCTLLCGGSVGKEAAALQLGGSVSSWLGPLVGLRDEEFQETFVMCGMAAALSAVLLAPLAAAVFVVEVMHRRISHPARLAAPALSSLTAFAVARLAGAHLVSPAAAALDVAGVSPLAVAALGVAAAVVAGAFIVALRVVRRAVSRLESVLLAIVVGGSAVSMLLGFTDLSPYGGTGALQIDAALAGEALPPAAFLAKAALTLLVLAAGFKGGEIMPVLCIGACLGSTFAVSAGLDGASTAALGMVALFAACSNCPLCSLVLGAELFGVSALPACALVALVAFACSYRCSLYQSAVIAWTPAGMLRALLRRPSTVQR